MSQTHKPLCDVLFLSFFELKNHVTSCDFTSFIYQCLNTWAAQFMLTQLAKKLLIFSQIHSIPHKTRKDKLRDSVVTVLCGFEAYTPCGFQTMDNKHCRSFGQWMLKDWGRFSVQGSPLSPASSKEEQASTKGNSHGLINYIDTKAECRHLKKFTCRGTLRDRCLSVWGPEPHKVYLFAQGRGEI